MVNINFFWGHRIKACLTEKEGSTGSEETGEWTEREEAGRSLVVGRRFGSTTGEQGEVSPSNSVSKTFHVRFYYRCLHRVLRVPTC